MYGGNYYGQAYYGQGPAIGIVYIFHSVSTTVVALASQSQIELVNQIVSATVTTVASITRQVQKILSASVTVVATQTSSLFEAINIRRGSTRFLNSYRSTTPNDGFEFTSKDENQKRTTNIITNLQ